MTEMQYVVFKLTNQRFCVDISNVSGITEVDTITYVPSAPKYIEGIIDLRGDIIPIVNLKARFNISTTSRTSDTRIIIISFEGKDVGFLVDDASEVLRLSADRIVDAPDVVKSKDSDYIKGVAKVDGSIAIELDLMKIFTEDERNIVLDLKEQ